MTDKEEEILLREPRGHPSMTPQAIAKRKAAYKQNVIYLVASAHPTLVEYRSWGYITACEPRQVLRAWKSHPNRLGVVKFETFKGHHPQTGHAVYGLAVRFESLGDLVVFEDEFNVKR